MWILLTLACAQEWSATPPPVYVVTSDCDLEDLYVYEAGSWVPWCPDWCECDVDTGDTGDTARGVGAVAEPW